MSGWPFRLEHPWFLLLPLLAALWLLWRRKGRSAMRRTVYLDLWEKAAEGARVWERWQWSRASLRLVLLWMAGLLGVLAASGPSWVGPGGGRYRVVLDRTASMLAQDSKGGSRWQEALESLQSFLDRRLSGDRVSLWTLADPLQPILAETADLALVRKSLASLPALTESSGVAEPLESPPGTWPHTLVLTDRIDWPGESLWGVGDSVANAGIVSFQAQGEWPSKELRFRLEVRNFSSHATERTVRFFDTQKREERRSLTLGPESSQTVEFLCLREQGGRVRVLLEPADAFPLDDEAATTLAPRPQAPLVLLESEEGSAFVSPLAAAAETLSEESGVAMNRLSDPAQAPPGAVLLAEGGQFESLPENAGGALLFGSLVPGLVGEPMVLQPKLLDWKRDHPVLRGLVFDFLACRQSWSVLGPNEPLLVSSEGALAFTLSRGESRIFATTFRLSDSNLPVQASFPVLLARAYAWTQGNPEDGRPGLLREGREIDFLDPREQSLDLCAARGLASPIPEGPGHVSELLFPCLAGAMLCLALALLLGGKIR